MSATHGMFVDIALNHVLSSAELWLDKGYIYIIMYLNFTFCYECGIHISWNITLTTWQNFIVGSTTIELQ
jgi:hypothetical protein